MKPKVLLLHKFLPSDFQLPGPSSAFNKRQVGAVVTSRILHKKDLPLQITTHPTEAESWLFQHLFNSC
jgi:hypothetical protein